MLSSIDPLAPDQTLPRKPLAGVCSLQPDAWPQAIPRAYVNPSSGAVAGLRKCLDTGQSQPLPFFAPHGFWQSPCPLWKAAQACGLDRRPFSLICSTSVYGDGHHSSSWRATAVLRHCFAMAQPLCIIEAKGQKAHLRHWLAARSRSTHSRRMQ